ncbi:glutamate racemase [Vibrio sp. MEBiC08052]|uniref:glutamate racemase n=1 Tax=Vibrio sp. MEBiC08052 TaxID=1761910 RepID=UPI00074064EA|nr:glutamate racemase [Vibrio sp. MEBiC08052]KUI96934.1 glutamate racemase [Vibrio sp. MEBiC08052]
MFSKVSNILIFDSGVGGLSVYREIQQLLPEHNYFYLFDNEGYPYGELPQQKLLNRVETLVTSIVTRMAIDIVVIACNTASTIVLPTLRKTLDIPVVGVVPAIKPACNLAQRCVGLIATPATIQRPYTHELIRDFSSDKEICLLGSTALVDMAERKLRGVTVNMSELANILQPLQGRIDVAVLGCTHFPLLRYEIQQTLGENVVLVDSGKAIARRVVSLISPRMCRHSPQTPRIFASASPYDGEALTRVLSEWGFNQIENFPLQGFLDHSQPEL